MGLWIGSPALNAAENVVWQKLANRTQGGRAVGGRLHLTETRLLFVPNHLDAITGGKRWEARLTQLRAVGRQSPDGGLFSGGLRTRLRVDTDAGTELFVIEAIDEAIAILDAARTDTRS
ncbi:hypothetical protein [Nocardia salmonicida]|uniref:hypothetical protein n=1 Tax=Nocardia salmonicida TaxID=53431 RepID=UPI0007A54892|nr:hypothetical protein [Nocardia salmonicida]